MSHLGLCDLDVAQLLKDTYSLISENSDYTLEDINSKLESSGWKNSVLDKSAFSCIMTLFADLTDDTSEKPAITFCHECSLFQPATDKDEKHYCKLCETGTIPLDERIPDWCPVENRIEAGQRIMANQNERLEIRFCSFCEKRQSEVKKLISGPGVYICDECVKGCAEILAQ